MAKDRPISARLRPYYGQQRRRKLHLPSRYESRWRDDGRQSHHGNGHGSSAFVDTSEFSACFAVADGSAGAGDIQFTSATYSVGEAGGTATITVARVGGSNGSVTAMLSTSNGTATAPGDYTAITNFPITYVEGETGTKTVNVTINNDAIFESNETVNLSLSATQITLPDPGSNRVRPGVNPHAAVLTIVDNDSPPSFSVDDVTHSEGDSGTTSYVFTVPRPARPRLPRA